MVVEFLCSLSIAIRTIRSLTTAHKVHGRRAGAGEHIVRMESLPQRLRRRAVELGLSDAEVARRAGLTERRYGHYTAGQREPNLGTLVRICGVLGVTPNDLLLDRCGAKQPSPRDLALARIQSAAAGLDLDDLRLAAHQVESLVEFRGHWPRQKQKSLKRPRPSRS